MRLKTKFDKAQTDKILRKIEDLQAPLKQSEARQLGDVVVDAMREDIEGGNSTIKGRGKFPAYRGEYRRRIQKYGRIGKFSKKLRPVNLTLTGEFLKNLKVQVRKVKQGYAPLLGFFETREQKMEEGHRTGHNGQAKRPIIPARNEVFTVKIQRVYLDLISRAIAKIAKRRD